MKDYKAMTQALEVYQETLRQAFKAREAHKRAIAQVSEARKAYEKAKRGE